MTITYKINHNFSGGFVSKECAQWVEQMSECSGHQMAKACCKDQGVPENCSGNCLNGDEVGPRQLKSVDVICGLWCDQIEECHQGSKEDLLACCKNKGVPVEYSGYCRIEGGVCEEWEQIESECREGNEGKECCEEQGVPEKCSAYCETA